MRDLVYISYSHKDKAWHQQLRALLDADPELRALVWDDTKIPAGADWEQEIKEHVARARVMIMLGSEDYFGANSGAAQCETRPALEARARGHVQILWVPVRSFDYARSPVARITAATGAGAPPLDRLSPTAQDKILKMVRDEVRRCLGMATNRRAKPRRSRSHMSEKSAGRSIVWLHLSDLHCCEDKTGWDAHRVLRPLVKDLKKMERDHGLVPQLLFFTGDAAFGNIGPKPGSTMKDQFDGAQLLLESASQAFTTPVPKENIFIVPGNHDVDRDQVTPEQNAWLGGQSETRTVTELIRAAQRQWTLYMDRLTQYREFLGRFHYDHLLADPKRLIYSHNREIHGLKIGIAGFNSAWACGQKEERGRLWFGGDWQLGTFERQLQDADFRLALTHHPLEWFVEPEGNPLKIKLERVFAFHLHGHEHLNWIDAKAGGHVRVAAAACYQCSWMENGYNFVRLNLDTGDGEVWLREFDPHGGGWVPRAIADKTDNDGRWKLESLSWLRELLTSQRANPH